MNVEVSGRRALMSLQRFIVWAMALALLCGATSALEAQIGARLRDAAARAAEGEAVYPVEWRAEKGARCVFGDPDCIRQAERDGKKVEVTDRLGNPTGQRDQRTSTAPAPPDAGAAQPQATQGSRTTITAGPAAPRKFVQIRAARVAQNSCGLTAEGELYCWGAPDQGASSNEPRRVDGTEHLRLRTFDLSPRGDFGCGVADDGVAYCWGNTYRSFLQMLPAHFGGPPPGLEAIRGAIPIQSGQRFAQLTVGVAHACALTVEGAAYCWRVAHSPLPAPFPITLGDGKGTPPREVTFSIAPVRVAINERLEHIAASFQQTCALASTGRVYCWGSKTGVREWHSPRLLTPAVQFSSLVNLPAATCGITRDRQVLCWELHDAQVCWIKWEGIDIRCSPAPSPVSVPGGFRTIAGSSDQTCGVSSDGTTYCWGYHVGRHLATPPPDRCYYGFDSKAVENLAAAGDRYAKSRAELESLRVTCSMRPLAIPGTGVFSQVGVGKWHACGLAEDGTAICWGKNDGGALGRGEKGDGRHLGPAPVTQPR